MFPFWVDFSVMSFLQMSTALVATVTYLMVVVLGTR